MSCSSLTTSSARPLSLSSITPRAVLDTWSAVPTSSNTRGRQQASGVGIHARGKSPAPTYSRTSLRAATKSASTIVSLARGCAWQCLRPAVRWDATFLHRWFDEGAASAAGPCGGLPAGPRCGRLSREAGGGGVIWHASWDSMGWGLVAHSARRRPGGYGGGGAAGEVAMARGGGGGGGSRRRLGPRPAQ